MPRRLPPHVTEPAAPAPLLRRPCAAPVPPLCRSYAAPVQVCNTGELLREGEVEAALKEVDHPFVTFLQAGGSLTTLL